MFVFSLCFRQSFLYIIYFIQIFDHFSFCSVIFSLTSGIKNLELNVNTPPIYLVSLRIFSSPEPKARR